MVARIHSWSSRRIARNEPILKVLVVDDFPLAAEALSTFLMSEEIHSQAVFGGLQAVRTSKAWRPHVIVMDISMPDYTGYDAARALRSDPLTSEIVIIAFSALDEYEVRRHLMDHEFDGYCQKGIPPTRLLTMIKEFAGEG